MIKVGVNAGNEMHLVFVMIVIGQPHLMLLFKIAYQSASVCFDKLAALISFCLCRGIRSSRNKLFLVSP